jgi:5-methylcytosine-specific restriction endonuclease McrA
MSNLFSAKTKDEALAAAAGKCSDCGGLLKPGQVQVHHKIPRWKGGDNSLSNAKVLCSACHLAADEDHDFSNMRAADRKAAKSKATLQSQRAIGPTQMQRRLGITQ